MLFEQEVGTRSLSYVIGKPRVAPIKYMTIPKLELQAAMTAVRLKNTLVLEHRLNIDSIIFWSDSSTVIQWIKNSTKKQPVFVANRVAEILESTSVDQWRHVPGEQNPADYGTRGLTVSLLKESTWLTGPAWLLDEEKIGLKQCPSLMKLPQKKPNCWFLISLPYWIGKGTVVSLR